MATVFPSYTPFLFRVRINFYSGLFSMQISFSQSQARLCFPPPAPVSIVFMFRKFQVREVHASNPLPFLYMYGPNGDGFHSPTSVSKSTDIRDFIIMRIHIIWP